MSETRHIFITGGTGYLGSALVPELLARGHRVTALSRRGSERKLPAGCDVVKGDALDASSFADGMAPADTVIHLVGTSHPAPWKAEQFRRVDLASVRAAVAAAYTAGVRHFVYLSVAQPAPAMRAYVAVRAECERLIAGAGLATATFLRPWYVLGPGHRWPYALVPFYALFECLPATRDTARRLGLVKLREMVGSLVWAVENPAEGIRVLDVPAIREMGATLPQHQISHHGQGNREHRET
jgi:uncharacterized protein YbjT (DUF2867 family)